MRKRGWKPGKAPGGKAPGGKAPGGKVNETATGSRTAETGPPGQLSRRR